MSAVRVLRTLGLTRIHRRKLKLYRIVSLAVAIILVWLTLYKTVADPPKPQRLPAIENTVKPLPDFSELLKSLSSEYHDERTDKDYTSNVHYGDPSQTPVPDDIYFLETAGFASLNTRQQCAIESALRLNRGSRIILLHTNKSFRSPQMFKLLKKMGNLVTGYLNLTEVVSGLPIERLAENITSENYWNQPNDISNVARVALLYKNGGSYYDLDFIFIKPLPRWRNCLHNEKPENVTNAAFSGFEKGHPLFEYIFERQLTNWRRGEWASGGRNTMTSAARAFDAEHEPKICRVPARYFFRTPWNRAGNKFWPLVPVSEVYWESIVDEHSTGIHVFNKVNKDLPLTCNSVYSHYGAKYCPFAMAPLRAQCKNTPDGGGIQSKMTKLNLW